MKALLAAPEMTTRRALPALRVDWGEHQPHRAQGCGGGGGFRLGSDASPLSSPLLSSMASATRFASSRLGSLDSTSGDDFIFTPRQCLGGAPAPSAGGSLGGGGSARPNPASGRAGSSSRSSPEQQGGGAAGPCTPPRRLPSSPDSYTSFLGGASWASPPAQRRALHGGASAAAAPQLRSPFAAPGWQSPGTSWADG